MLTVAGLRAELSIRQALQGRFVVKSLDATRPVLTIARAADGRTNLPAPPPGRPAVAGTPAGGSTGGPAPGRSTASTASTAADGPDRPPRRPSFDLHRLTIAGGEVRLDLALPPGGVARFATTVCPIDGDVDRAADAAPFALSIGSIEVARDAPDGHGPIDLGPVRVDGRMTDAPDLASLARAGLDASLSAGPADAPVRATLRMPSVTRPDLAATLAGSLDLAAAAAFLAALQPLASLMPSDPLPPATRSLLASAASGGVAGRVTVDLAGTYDGSAGLRLDRAEASATGLRLAVPAAGPSVSRPPAGG